MIIFVWLFKLAAWLVVQIGIGLLVDSILFGSKKRDKHS